jgi:tetratricopeptide (TPR) repeat protein
VNALSYFKPVLLKRKGVTLGLWGEAGIGKSYTVKRLLETLPCRHLSLHASSSLANLAKALPKPKKLATWAARSLEHLGQGELLETSAIISALGTTLAGLAPFVLYVEDIHEVDGEGLAFFQQLAHTVQRTKGVGFLVTSRKEPPEPFSVVRLEPLSKQASDELLTQELTATLPKEASQWIYSKAAGNPLYTLEYLRYLARQGYLWNDGKNWRWRQPGQGFMPITIEALIEQQLTQAKTSAINSYVLESRAFLPLEVTDEVWMKVARINQEELQAAIRELQQESIFRDDTFIHPLYKEVTLQTLKQPRRQHFARRIINALQDAPEQMALYVDDANLAKEQALELLTKAAHHAREANKNFQAGHLLAKAVPYADGEEKGKLALGAAQLLDGLDYSRVLELATRASELLAEPSEALYLQAVSLALQGKYEAMQQVVQIVPDTSKQGSLWLQRYIRLLHLTTKHKELVGFWESQTPLQEQTDGTTVYSVAWAYIHLGNFSAASALVARWLAKADLTPLDSWNLLEVQATIAFYQGKYQEAEIFYSQALELSGQLPKSNNLLQDVANILRNRSVTRLQLGRYGESLPDLQEALKIYSDSGNSIYYAQTLVMTSYVYVELGELERTEDVLLEALDIFSRVTPQPFLSHALVQLSDLYADLPHRHYLARKYALDAMRVAHEVTDTSCLTVATYALARVEYVSGNFTKALELSREAQGLATCIDNFEALLKARALKGLALKELDQMSEAREELTAVCEAATAQSMMLEANKFGLDLDRLNHDIKSAKVRMQWFEERGLMNSVNTAKRYFPELAEKVESETLESSSKILINVLGSMQIVEEGKTETVQGRKRQELLALLLEAKLSGHAEVSRLELFGTLYPDKDELKAMSSLKELVSALRERLGANAITTTATGYALGAVQSDAEVFLQTGDTTLWRDVYLKDVALESHKSVAESLYGLLYAKAQDMLGTNPKETARLARVLLEADPYHQDYLKVSLQALRASNNHKTLTRLYAESKERFMEVGETLPEQWQEFLVSQ